MTEHVDLEKCIVFNSINVSSELEIQSKKSVCPLTYKNSPVLTPMHNITLNIVIK